MTNTELHNIILKGENSHIEFKQSFSKAVIETIVAFSNTKGGQILIGVKDNGGILDVNISEESIPKWINEIKQSTFPSIIPDFEVVLLKGKTIIVIDVKEYPVKPISYKNKY